MITLDEDRRAFQFFPDPFFERVEQFLRSKNPYRHQLLADSMSIYGKRIVITGGEGVEEI